MSSLVKAGRCAARCSACLGSLLVASIAASQWVVNQYTGGTATIGGIPWSYTGYQWGYGGASPNGNCGGTIDAEFLWVGDPDAVPTRAVLIQKCYVLSWVSNMGTPISAGSVDNGLSDSVTATSTQSWISPPGIWQYVRSNEAGKNGDGSLITTYQIVENPGEEPVYQCTPSAAIASTGNRNVQVVYSAELVPLEIVFEDSDGIGEAWERRYLIGQQCLATISSTIEVTDHVWSVAEEVDPFLDWIADQDAGGPRTEVTDFYSEELEVRFAEPLVGADPDPEDILWCEVRLLAPTGTKFIGSDETEIVRRLTVNKPTASLSGYIGTVQLTNAGTPADQMQLWGATVGPASGGMIWVAWSENFNGFGSGGGWNFVQTVTPHRRRYYQGAWQGLNINDIENMLDTTYPYDPFGLESYPEDVFPNDGESYFSKDSPKTGFASGATEYEVIEPFEMYMMYLPPGSGARFVPLRAIEWFYEGEAALSGTWSLFGTAAAWDFSDNFPHHPAWDRRIGDVSIDWVAE